MRKTIYDLGFHEGQDTAYYLKKGFRVVAVEANPLLYQRGRRTFAAPIASGDLVLLNVGIGPEPGTFPFFINHGRSGWSSFVEEIGGRGGSYSRIDIPCNTLDRIIEANGLPYFVKIDIEGREFEALKALGKFPPEDRPAFVSIENGYEHFIEEFVTQGYSGFQFINQAEVPNQREPLVPREGVYAGQSFAYGASGLFGNDLPGQWLDAKSILTLTRDHYALSGRSDSVHGWFDLHAKR